MNLPTSKIPAILQDPKNLILFGQPKVGKTTLLSYLDNCLILDFEDGSDYVEALKIKIPNLTTLRSVCKEIKENGNPYKFIAIDTVTALEDFAKPLALSLFKASPQGSKSDIDDVLKAPMGAGQKYRPVFG